MTAVAARVCRSTDAPQGSESSYKGGVLLSLEFLPKEREGTRSVDARTRQQQ